MIKAVFLDFYNTLVAFDPPRNELQVNACREFGIEVRYDAIPRGYWSADDFMSRENGRIPIQQRSETDQNEFWAEYEQILLENAGVNVSRELALKIFTRMRQLNRRLVLFDDVLPALEALKSRNIVLGLISNLNRNLDSTCASLGLDRYLDFVLTSLEAGSEKPHPPIFLAALKRAGVTASEAIHVGDLYYSDVVGAKSVGIKPLLIDRLGFGQQFEDCQRIQSLTEIVDHL
ncbi:HAD family hydrolase [Chloroflexota bacterium]